MTTRIQRRLAKKKAATLPTKLEIIHEKECSFRPKGMIKAWKSRDYLVQLFEGDSAQRLTVSSTVLQKDSWADGIEWDELMEIKRQCGFADRVAVEIYPNDSNIVHVSNMRHLWILDKAPEFMWGAKEFNNSH